LQGARTFAAEAHSDLQETFHLRDARRKATFVAEPLERGFGPTLGNSLRRVLLSSLQGAAVTSIRVEGVLHEFSSLAGVREDITDLVLNVKQIALRMEGDQPKRLQLSATGPGEVTAGQIATSGDIEVMNPNLVLCHLANPIVRGLAAGVNRVRHWWDHDSRRARSCATIMFRARP
jgi:DNA-directed RNA polymerase alpha subunit